MVRITRGSLLVGKLMYSLFVAWFADILERVEAVSPVEEVVSVHENALFFVVFLLQLSEVLFVSQSGTITCVQKA